MQIFDRFFTKKDIQFISMVEGIEETMPILPMSEYRYDWLKKAGDKIKERKKNLADWNKSNSTLKCPAMLTFRNKGFILRAPWDIHLTIESENSYKWRTSIGNENVAKDLTETVTHHNEDLFFNFMSSWPKDTMEIVLKLNLPWAMRIPKGYEVLMVEPFYKDDCRFTTCSGVFDSDLGIARLTVPIMWHSTKGSYIIKTGTPIAQLIPVKKDTITHQNLNLVTDKKFKRDDALTYIKMTESFNTNYDKAKKFLRGKI